MTLCELQEYIKNENINLKDIRIILGEKLSISNAEGIYEDENGTWHLYECGERSDATDILSGSEEEVVKEIYSCINSRNKAVKKHGKSIFL